MDTMSIISLTNTFNLFDIIFCLFTVTKYIFKRFY